jgi:muconate cycloisomerase
MMTITNARILTVQVPFRFNFRHAKAARSRGESVLLELTDQEGRAGFGESVPREYVTGETPRTVVDVLRTRLVPGMLRPFESFEEVVAVLTEASTSLPRDSHAAFCALELALLDLAGKVFRRPAGSVIGPVLVDELRYSGIVPTGELDAAVSVLSKLQKSGFEQVKIKVGLSESTDRQVLSRAREILGEKCSLRVDVNGAWKAEQALQQIEAWAPFRLEAIEQPLPSEDLAGLVWLTRRSPTPILVDESLVSIEDARRLADQVACHGFNIRVSKCGGLLNSTRIRSVAEQAGLSCMLGAQVGELAVLSAAGRQFGTRSQGLLFCEGSYGTILLERDVATEDLTIGRGGAAPAIEGDGLGIEIDAEALAALTTDAVPVGGDAS